MRLLFYLQLQLTSSQRHGLGLGWSLVLEDGSGSGSGILVTGTAASAVCVSWRRPHACIGNRIQSTVVVHSQLDFQSCLTFKTYGLYSIILIHLCMGFY